MIHIDCPLYGGSYVASAVRKSQNWETESRRQAMANELTDTDRGFMRVALVAHLLGSADRDLSADGVAHLVQWADAFLWARNEYVRARHKGAVDFMDRFIGMAISSEFEVLQKAEEYVADYDKRHG